MAIYQGGKHFQNKVCENSSLTRLERMNQNLELESECLCALSLEIRCLQIHVCISTGRVVAHLPLYVQILVTSIN